VVGAGWGEDDGENGLSVPQQGDRDSTAAATLQTRASCRHAGRPPQQLAVRRSFQHAGFLTHEAGRHQIKAAGRASSISISWSSGAVT